MKISVALAAYNGEKFIAQQLDSVLKQLPEDGEVVVSDDGSTDATAAICRKTAEMDKRLKYIQGSHKGVSANFENALKSCTGDIILLCDQDDVWVEGKVEKCVEAIKSGASLVLHDASVTDAELNVTESSYFALRGTNTSFSSNLLKNTFVGCCMAFDRKVLEAVTPFPRDIPMHDWWIALAAIKKGMTVKLINEPLILWRRHGANATTEGKSTNSAAQQLKWRLTMTKLLMKV